MKIIIDETTFNKAIEKEKLQLAEWLLENNCPFNDTAYLQKFDIKILNWLKANHIPMTKDTLANVIDKTGDISIISWFMENGAEVNNNSLKSCIRNNKNQILWLLSKKIKMVLDSEYPKIAVLAENIEILDYLLQNGVKFTEEIHDIAMKNKKKQSIKWLINNNLF